MTWTLTTITVNGLIRPTALILQEWDGPAAAAAAGASLSLYGRSPGPRDFYNTILMLFTPQLRDLKILAAVYKTIGCNELENILAWV